MGSKPKAPKPINVQQVAGEQSQQNTQNTQTQQQYNRPDQTNQYGSQLQWTQNPDGSFSQSQSLGGTGQQFASGFNQLGQQYIDQAGRFVGNRPDMSSNGAFDKAYDYATSTLNRTQADQSNALDNKLKNQGLVAGTEAYDKGMRSLLDAQGDQKNGLITSLQGQLFNQGLQDRAQQGSELSLLNPGVQYGGQAISGGFAGTNNLNVPNVDLTALYGQKQQQLNQNYQSQMQGYNGMLGGLAGLGGTLGTAAIKYI